MKLNLGLITTFLTGFFLVWASPAKAQTTAVQQISVVVNGLFSIMLTEPNYVGDELSSTFSVGDFAVRSNQKDGYEVWVLSANGSKLEDADGVYSIDYTLSSGPMQSAVGIGGIGTTYPNVVVGTTNNGSQIYDGVTFSAQNCAAMAGCRNGLTLNLAGVPAEVVPENSYSDTLTYTILAK